MKSSHKRKRKKTNKNKINEPQTEEMNEQNFFEISLVIIILKTKSKKKLIMLKTNKLIREE